ncbi:MAG TPA: flagellar hook-associated protein FlgK [Acidobacteriaceae bacterium]
MGGLNTSLSIGMQALDAAQGALDVTSHNIANANTPGYSEEVVQLSANSMTMSRGQVSGGGVTLDGLQGTQNQLINLQIQQQTSLQSSTNTQSASLQQMQTFFTTTGTDVASALTALSSSLVALSASPGSSVTQQSVLASGQNLAQAFNTTANGLTSAQSTADGLVTESVAQINTLTQQIGALNGQVARLTASGQSGGAVEDQLNQSVQQLSQLTGISITQSSDGETITTGSGTPLVMGDQSFSLQTTTGSDGFQQVLDFNGKDITNSIQGGQLGGAIQVRDTTVPGLLSQLNTLASQFANSFNAVQAGGIDSNGNPGQNVFTIPINLADAASGISVAITNPALIAVSSVGSPNSNGNVASLSAVLTTALPSGQTAAMAYASLVFDVGSQAANASTQSTAIGENLLQLTNQLGATSGVNINDETANLIRFQTAYEAGARIVSTIQQLYADTMNMMT